MSDPAHLATPPTEPNNGAAAAQPATPPAEPPAQPAGEPGAPPAAAPEPPAAPPAEPSAQGTPPEPAADPEPPRPSEPVRVVPKVEDYVLPEGLPREVAQFAHNNDMTQDQLNNTLAEFARITQGNEQATKMLMRQEGDALVRAWGEQGQYNLSLARRALKQNDPDGQLGKVLEESGYGNHPAVLNFLFKLGSHLKEGGFLRSAVNAPGQGAGGKQTAAQAMFGNTHPSNQD